MPIFGSHFRLLTPTRQFSSPQAVAHTTPRELRRLSSLELLKIWRATPAAGRPARIVALASLLCRYAFTLVYALYCVTQHLKHGFGRGSAASG